MDESDLNRIESSLDVSLPKSYRDFILQNAGSLQEVTYQSRGETEQWFFSEFFGFDVERTIVINQNNRGKESMGGYAFPDWWDTYFVFGSNGGDGLYVVRLDNQPGIWVLHCDGGRTEKVADSFTAFVDESMSRYASEQELIEKLNRLWERFRSGDIDQQFHDQERLRLICEHD